MPKPRARAAVGAPSYFSVSPWQDRDEPRQADEGPAGYSIVEMPLIVRGGSGGGGAAARPADAAVTSPPDARAVNAAEAAARDVAPPIQRPNMAAAAAAPPAAGGGWLTKKRKVTEEDDAAQQPAGGTCPLPARGGTVGEPDAAAGEQREPTVELEGTAYLALLPNGSVTGHLVCVPSALTGGGGWRSFGLMAEVVVAGRECTRDADWGVLRMTLVDFAAAPAGAGGGACRELSFLVERTEGDAMRLRAPVPWQGIELEDLPSLDATCSCPSASGLSLDFRCSQLLSGEAGEAVLRRLQPSLAGRGALLNVGEMRVGLPPEAAAVLLGSAAGAAGAAVAASTAGGAVRPVALQHQTPSPRQEGGAAVQRAASEQRRVTGRGSGGAAGRVVADAEDDW
ncbi:hypothetical protein ABPG75_004941 [Micractinium tetrahymenae]